jgi:hypothetical protein
VSNAGQRCGCGTNSNQIVPLLRIGRLYVVAVQNPLTSLSVDVAATRRIIVESLGQVIKGADFFPMFHNAKPPKGESNMSTITVKDGTQIYFKDWGKGQPIVFSHGWPLSANDWDGQMLFFGQRGYRGGEVARYIGRHGSKRIGRASHRSPEDPREDS